MSSTVTVTTVAAFSSAMSPEIAASFSLMAVALLGVLLMGREVINFNKGVGLKRLARGLDIATLPMIVAFVLIIGIKFGDGG